MHKIFLQLDVDYSFIRSRTIGKENTCEGQGSPTISLLKQTSLGCFDFSHLCKIYTCAIKWQKFFNTSEHAIKKSRHVLNYMQRVKWL